MASLDSEAYQALNDSQSQVKVKAVNVLRQQTHGVNKQIKEITEMTQSS